MMRLLLATIGLLVALCGSAQAQSSCSYIAPGAVLTAAQWNACFQGKQDFSGFTPLTANNILGSSPIVVTPSGSNVVVSFSPCSTGGAFPIYNATDAAWECSTVGDAGSVATLNGGPFTINPTTSTWNRGLNITQSTGSTTISTSPAALNYISATIGGAVTATGSTNGFPNADSAALRVDSFVNSGTVNDHFAGIFTASQTGPGTAVLRGLIGFVYSNQTGGVGHGVDGIAVVDVGGSNGQFGGIEASAGICDGSGPQGFACQFTGTPGTAVNRYAITVLAIGQKQATTIDTAIIVGNNGSAGAAWQNLITLSAYGGQNPLSSTASFFATDAGYTVANFINLPTMTFTGNIINVANTTLSGSGVFTTTSTSSAPLSITSTSAAGNISQMFASAGKAAAWQFVDGATAEWNIGKQTDNTFVIRDLVDTTSVVVISQASGGGSVTINSGVLTPLVINGANAAGTYIQVLATAGQTAGLQFLDGVTDKWHIGKQTDNTFVIRDVPNSATRFIVNTGGNTTIGSTVGTPSFLEITKNTSNAQAAGTTNDMLRIVQADGVQNLTEWVATGAGSGNVFAGSYASGTLASPTAAVATKFMMSLRGFGYTGSAWYGSTFIEMLTGETFSGTAGGGYIRFETTPLTTQALNSMVVIQPSGGVTIQTGAAAGTNDPGGGGLYVGGATVEFKTLANTATTSAVCYNTTSGLLTYDGTIGTCNTSDQTLKDFDGELADPLDNLVALSRDPHFGYFQWKDPQYGSGRKIGIGAQTVARYFPELTATGSDGLMSLAYDKLTVPIIAAIAALKADNDNLRAELSRRAQQ